MCSTIGGFIKAGGTGTTPNGARDAGRFRTLPSDSSKMTERGERPYSRVPPVFIWAPGVDTF